MRLVPLPRMSRRRFFRFRGSMSLSSDDTYPVFEGSAQIVQECDRIRPDWFRFKSPINPKEVKLIVDDAPVNNSNSKIYTGIFLTNDSTHIYPAFFSGRKNYSDHQLVKASGVLHYDRDSMIYFIASESKLRNRDTIGNLIALNRDRCLLSGEGRLGLGIDLGRVKMDVVGRITHNLNNSETSLDVMMSLNFHFDDALAGMIAAKMTSNQTLTGVDMRRPVYVRGMNEWLGIRRNETFRRDALLGNVREFPDELKKTIVFTQLRLHWNRSNRSYQSVGKIGVGNLFGHQVNRLVDGMIEITKRPGGDFMDIYLKLDDNNWFYFGYTREVMQVLSSDQAFNERLMKLPEKQRVSADKRPGFRFIIATNEKRDQFVRHYQQQLTQIEQAPPPPPVIREEPRAADQQQPVTQPEKKEEDNVPIIELE